MDNNFNNTNGADEERTVLIQPDMNGNPQVVPQGMAQPQYGQAPQGMAQPQYGQAPQGMPAQPQYGQAPQGMPTQPQYGQAPQFGQQAAQFGQTAQEMTNQPMFGQTSQGMPGANSQYGAAPQQMSLNNGGNNSNSPKKGNGSRIAIIAVCAVVVIALIIGLVLILGGGDDKDKDKDTTESTTEATTEETTEATTEATTEVSTEVSTEETTEATTEAASTEAVESAGIVDVSGYGFTTNDWTSLEFALDGKVYTWPISYAQIKEAGYTVDSSIESETLDSMYYSFNEWAYKDGEYAFFIAFKNYTDETKTVADCDIKSFSFSSGYDDIYEVVLCNGITIGTSFEDVMAVMGTPTDEYVSETSEYGYRTATYDVTDDIYCNSIEFTFTEGVVSEIEITNED